MSLYNYLRGILSSPPADGLLAAPQPTGLMGALTVNPLMARQVEAHRAANPRPDVTDIFGYGPSWTTYLQNMNRNLQAQLPQLGDSGEVMAKKGASLLGNFAPFGITVFHGSPHKFDKFDMGKVGTGEGAQAYGHGLYFAENAKVARDYRNKLSDPDTTLLPNDAAFQELAEFGNRLRPPMASEHSFRAQLQAYADDFPQAREVLNAIDAGKLKFGTGGNLYKVDLPDEAVAKMLDWDKPLSQQPESVKRAIETIVEKYPILGEPSIRMKVKGIEDNAGYFFSFLRNKVGDEQASQMLRDAGVPGIKYLDQGSRTAGSGTRNFVVFDDGIPRITGTEPGP